MINRDIKNYIYECRRQGLDDGQIASKLGVDISWVKEFFKPEKNKVKPEVKKEPVKEKPVSGAAAKAIEEEISEPVPEPEKESETTEETNE